MNTNNVLIKKLDTNSFELPKYQTEGSVGMDLSAFIGADIVIKPNERELIPTGIAISLPQNIEGQVRPRSGLALKYGITVLNTPGTIDSDYRGEIKVILINHGKEDFLVKNNDRIAQIVFSEVVKVSLNEVDDLDQTLRDQQGFGSTGK
ncbi:MAG: dUTP diphosphatase [Pelagibacteraceae bacterium]|nr:dUTP diphosphatase [Pelagibacteraceae bacterium]|tara:strand:+ start:5317 stop:5763 length:447 start_codon:yes stop_codon:yes gene_type:complete